MTEPTTGSEFEPAPLPEGPLGAACREAWERTCGFLAGGLSRKDQARMRAHLESCEECTRRYRVAVGTAAHIGRPRRVERAAEERTARRQAQRRLAFSGGDAPIWRANRRWRLRTLLMPAFVIFLILQVSWLGRGSSAHLEWREGRVMAAQRLLEGKEPVTAGVVDGDWCATAEDSRARLALLETHIDLAPFTGLWIETVLPARLRLRSGRVTVDGPCTLTTASGVVEVLSGRATIAESRGRLSVRCHSGVAVVIDSRGEVRLGPDEAFGDEISIDGAGVEGPG